MKIPKNMTEEQVLNIMRKVIDKTAAKYTFYGYTINDIKQESYIICIDALERYDGNRRLENFLSVNLSNRLKNFVRDNHYVSSSYDDRVKVLQPAQLDYEDTITEQDKISEIYEKIDYDYISSNIDRFLPADMRMDYLKLISGMYLSKHRKEQLVELIKEIMSEVGYEER